MRRRCGLVLVGLVMAGCMKPAPVPAPAPGPAPVPASASDPASNPVRPTLAAIQFTDVLHGRATGAVALTTADSGQTWTAIDPREGSGEAAPAPPPGLPADSDSWCAAGPSTFLAVSGTGVARTQDGGRIWAPAFGAPLPGDTWEWRGKIECRGPSAWVLFVGAAAMSHQSYAAFRSPDAGDTWAPILASGYGVPVRPNTQASQTIDAYAGPFDVVDAETAFFIGACPACYPYGASITGTADGGRTWQHHAIAAIREVDALSFVDGQHGWIVAYDRAAGSLILATADGGETWQRQYPPAP